MKKTFRKAERLYKEKLIQALFRKGSSFHAFPLTVRFLANADIECHQVLVSVPKKVFGKAVDRNKLKRRIKEAYRLRKHLLNANAKCFYLIGFIYTAKKFTDFDKIEKSIIFSLKKIPRQKPE